MKERLNKFVNCFKISFFLEEIILYKVYSFGAEALLELRKDMMLLFHLYQQVAEMFYYYFHLKDSLEKLYVNILCFFHSFSYRGKLVIKVVSNIIGNGYSITIIKGEYIYYAGCYSFQRNKECDFLFVLNIIPILSKYLS